MGEGAFLRLDRLAHPVAGGSSGTESALEIDRKRNRPDLCSPQAASLPEPTQTPFSFQTPD